MQISGKIALITGAASGIGQAVARELAKRGTEKVILVDRLLGCAFLAFLAFLENHFRCRPEQQQTACDPERGQGDP